VDDFADENVGVVGYEFVDNWHFVYFLYACWLKTNLQ
jgi:hypothetical protein